MLWSKQYYDFDLDQWLREHRSHPLLESARHGMRNTEWFHMLNADVISMPDKWEYPWYAAWDLERPPGTAHDGGGPAARGMRREEVLSG
jgi:hypothetical protein